MLTAEQISSNYELFRRAINELFPNRAEQLNAMYDDLSERLALDPASSIEHYHNAFPGGYVDHVIRVVDFAKKEYDHWKNNGLKVDNFTLEELLFAAFHHDLGKLGLPGADETHRSYVPNVTKEWHRKNLGQVYNHNSNLPFSLIQHNSLFLLQYYGVQITWQEYLAIQTHDGLYDEANKPYYLSRSIDSIPKTNINRILHNADLMAARFEFERWAIKNPTKFNFYNEVLVKPEIKPKQPTTPQVATSAMDAFKKAFGE